MIGEIDSYLFSSAPRGSTMWKIWQTKNSPNEICRFEKSFANSKFIRGKCGPLRVHTHCVRSVCPFLFIYYELTNRLRSSSNNYTRIQNLKGRWSEYSVNIVHTHLVGSNSLDEHCLLKLFRYFWLSRKSTVHFLALVISKLIPIKLWMNEDFVLYNFFLSFYMKSSIQPAKRKWIDKTYTLLCVNYWNLFVSIWSLILPSSLTFSVTSYIQADLMNPEVYLKFRQYAYNLNVLVTSIDSFVEEHTTTREFTIDDYYHYFTLFCCIYASTFIAFCLHHCYRLFRTNRNLVLPFSDWNTQYSD